MTFKSRKLSSSVLMYADDTSLTLSANDAATLEEKLNKDISEVQKWLQSNKLAHIKCKKKKTNMYDYWKPLSTKAFI